ncbi:deoxyribose-phosphate aldolase, partial [Staphylococcus hyicus]
MEHPLLKPESTRAQIENCIEEAKNYHFKSIFVHPTHVAYAHENLADSDVLVCTVIGFPFGANTPEVKPFGTTNAIEHGADEIDMVINIAALKDVGYDDVQKKNETVVKAAPRKQVKVIIKATFLTEDRKIKTR